MALQLGGRFASIDRKLSVLTWMVATNIAVSVGVLFQALR
jgi:hypothetical protein